MKLSNAASLLALLACQGAYAHAQNGTPPTPAYVVSAKGGYLVCPSRALGEGAVRASFSPDGAYLLLAQMAPVDSSQLDLDFDGSSGLSRVGPLTISGWDRANRQLRRLWRSDDPSARLERILWLRGAPEALLVIESAGPASRPVYGVLALNAATGDYRWIDGLTGLARRPFLSVSPLAPIAMACVDDSPLPAGAPSDQTSTLQQLVGALQGGDGGSFTFTLSGGGQSGPIQLSGPGGAGGTIQISFGNVALNEAAGDRFMDLDAHGSVVRAVAVAPPVRAAVVWSADGSAWYLEGVDPATKKACLMRLNADGSQTAEPTVERFVAKPAARDLALFVQPATAKLGTSAASYASLWLTGHGKAGPAEALLAPEATGGELSPTEDAVYYVEGGVAKVRPLILLTGEQLRGLQRRGPARPGGSP